MNVVAEVLDQRRDALQGLLTTARLLSASADLDEILRVIIDAMRDTLHAERATVFEYDPTRHELFTTVAHGVGMPARAASPNVPHSGHPVPAANTAAEIRISTSTGLAGECARTGRIINVPDAYADARFNQAVDRQTGFRTRSILTIPLTGHDGELVGVTQVLNKHGGPFTSADEDLATALAAQAAVAIKRGRLIEDRLVKLRMERDLELARQIQQNTFPQRLPVMRHFDFAGFSEPADEAGGDAFDVIGLRYASATSSRHVQPAEESDIDEPVHRAVMLMADATGHGIGPAMSVTQLRSMLRMAVRLGADLPALAHHANRQLLADLPPGRFVTAWFASADDEEGTLTTLSAGQGPLLHYHARTDDFEVLAADTVPLGVMDSAEMFTPTPRVMEPGDIYAAISDGIYEAMNAEHAQMGEARVIDAIRAARTLGGAGILHAVREATLAFTKGHPAGDDQTAVIVVRR